MVWPPVPDRKKPESITFREASAKASGTEQACPGGILGVGRRGQCKVYCQWISQNSPYLYNKPEKISGDISGRRAHSDLKQWLWDLYPSICNRTQGMAVRGLTGRGKSQRHRIYIGRNSETESSGCIWLSMLFIRKSAGSRSPKPSWITGSISSLVWNIARKLPTQGS